MHRQLAQHLRSSLPKGHLPTSRETWGNFGETRGGVGKSGTKAAISLKCVKIEEKLLWTFMEGLWELTNALSNGTIPTPYCLLFPKIGGLQPPPKTSIAIISERVKLYGLQIWPVYTYSNCPSEQKPIKILEKRERGRNQVLPNFFGYPLLF